MQKYSLCKPNSPILQEIDPKNRQIMTSSPFRNDLLKGKHALVTGAGKGIGRACAIALTDGGAKTTAIARTQADLDSLKNECGELLHPIAADALSEECLQTIAGIKDIDILINNLGTNKVEPLVEVTEQTLDLMLNINVRSLIRITQAVVKNMLAQDRGGSIINMSSQMGHIGSPGRTMYCTTKHAVEGFTKALAVELAESGIRVNAVAPTFIKTPLTEPMLEDETFKAFVMDMIPMRQIGEVEDVANAVIYLASDASRLVTGTSMRVDGGWTAR